MVSGISSSSSLDLSKLSDAQSKLLKKIDTDGDGKITKEEFLTGIKSGELKPPSGETMGTPPMGGLPKGMPPGGAHGPSKANEKSNSTSSTDSTEDDVLTTIEENLKKLLDSFKSISTSDSETTTSITDLLKNLEKINQNQTSDNSNVDKTKLFESIRNEILSVLEKNGLYNQQGSKSVSETQNLLDVTV